MSGGGRRSVGPPMSKFWSDLQASGEQMSTRDKGLHAPLGLCTPVPVRRYLQVTKRILLSSELLLGLEPNKHSVTGSICRKSQTCHERSGYRERPSLRNQVGSELDLTDAGKLNHTATRYHRGSQASGGLTVGYRARYRVVMACKPRSKLKRVLVSGRSVRRGVQESVPSNSDAVCSGYESAMRPNHPVAGSSFLPLTTATRISSESMLGAVGGTMGRLWIQAAPSARPPSYPKLKPQLPVSSHVIKKHGGSL
jgi:hypothetical protein